MIPFEREPERGGSPEPGRRAGDDGWGDLQPESPRPEPTAWGGRLRGFGAPAPGARVREFPPRASTQARASRGDPRGGWLVPPLMLAAVAAGLLFVWRGPDQVFGLAFGLVIALGIVWILVSALLPGKAERTCPTCGEAGLERLDRETTQGLRCRLCGWQDEDASSFLLAEEEGPLEEIVLRQRRRQGHRRW